MDVSENDYCRLCADLKLCSDLSNMEINVEKRQDILNKLARFGITLNFNNILPKNVCYVCVKSLEHAYDFITSVDLAQEAFADYVSAPDIEKDERVSDNESMNNEPLDTGKNEEVMSDTETTEYEPPDTPDCEPPEKPDSLDYDEQITNDKSCMVSREEVDMEYNPVIIKIESSKYDSEASTENSKLSKSSVSYSGSIKNKTKRKKVTTVSDVELSESWEEYNWLCAYCDRYFQSSSELIVHSMQYHSTCNPYRCFDCRARGLHIDNFVTHICRHRPCLQLTCYKCSLKLNSLKEMKIHKATHLESDYICIGCNTTFSNQDELDEHTNMFYKNADTNNVMLVQENQSLTCVICQWTSKSKTLLNRHLLRHTDRKRDHNCDICGKSFYNKKELGQHVVVHSVERPYQCEICKFSFKLKSELKKHIGIHFGPKDFVCNECGKCFRSKKELVTHSVVHTDMRPYECTYCDKNFRFRHLLQQHIRLHTGIKPYHCEICPMEFRNWSNYNKHTRDVHKVDNSTRKRTSDGLYALDPVTKTIIYPDPDKMLEWKDNLLAEVKKGRPKQDVGNSGTAVNSKEEFDNSDESDESDD